MSIVYRTYLHTIMENNKVVFLCLILLLVLVVSNYMKAQEGFVIYGCPLGMSATQCAIYKGIDYAANRKSSGKASDKKGLSTKSMSKAFKPVKDAFNSKKSSSSKKKKGPDVFKSPRKIAREEANKVKKIANNAMAEAKKALAAVQTSTIASNKSNVKKGRTNEKLNQHLQQMQSLAKNTETLAKNTEKKIKENDALNNQVLGKVSGLDANIKQISNSASTIDAKLANVTKINNSFETNASNSITNISGMVETVNKSVEANKQIQNEINKKVDGVDKQVDKIKTYTDTVIQIKNDVDRIMNEFKLSSETMLKTMQLAVDKMDASKIGTKTQGFQNMNDPVLQASESLKKDMEMAKSLAFTTIDSAYNGDLHLETPWNSAEGFVDSTTTKSAYVDPADIFNLEKEVLTAFNNFNTKYYDIYQTCLQSKRKIKDRIKNGEKGLTEPNCGTSMKEVYDAKTELIGKITTLNAAIVAMGKKSESIAVDSNGNYLISNRKVTEEEFKKRHQQIKDLHNNISSMRSDLDMKMANLLDKTKGPLPEAQNKYNYENYATIGWSILATSILYYTFVEMK